MSRYAWVRGCLALSIAAALPCAAAAPPDCKADLDACVRMVVAETAVFTEACGKAYPQARSQLDSAFRQWPVLALPIPNLQEATASDSPLQAALRSKIMPYLEHVPAEERQIECSGRLQMMRSAAPALHGDSARLPPDALDKYQK